MKHFEQEIEINAPVAVCYQLWHDHLQQSVFMPNVKSVKYLHDNVWRWVLIGPFGDAQAWDAMLLREIPNQLISWKSVEGPEFDMWLDINFFPLEHDRTLVRVAVETCPITIMPSGLLEELYALSPEIVIKNLRAFRAYAESVYQQTTLSKQGHILGRWPLRRHKSAATR